MESEFGGYSSRRDVMRPAKRGQEIVKRILVGDVDHGQPRAYVVAVVFERKQVVIADRYTKQIALGDAREILVRRFGVWCRN